MTARTRAARAAAALILAGATLVGTAGCTFLTPTGTLTQYVPGEGMNLTVGSVAIRNALALPNEDGSVVSLVVTITDTSSSGTKLNLQYDNGGEKVDESVIVGGGGTISFGGTPEARQLLLETDGIQAGSLLPIYVQQGDEPGSMLLVPVLDPNQPDYEGLAPRE
ncbi:MAG: hypothetical protein WA006_05865 [Rhodoglobus sp.]